MYTCKLLQVKAPIYREREKKDAKLHITSSMQKINDLLQEKAAPNMKKCNNPLES